MLWGWFVGGGSWRTALLMALHGTLGAWLWTARTLWMSTQVYVSILKLKAWTNNPKSHWAAAFQLSVPCNMHCQQQWVRARAINGNQKKEYFGKGHRGPARASGSEQLAIFTVLGQCRSQLSTQRMLSFCLRHDTKAKWINSGLLPDGFVTELRIQIYMWWVSLFPPSTRRAQGPALCFAPLLGNTRVSWTERMGAELCLISPILFSFSLSYVHSQWTMPTKEVRCPRQLPKAVHSWRWGLNQDRGNDSQEERDVFCVSCGNDLPSPSVVTTEHVIMLTVTKSHGRKGTRGSSATFSFCKYQQDQEKRHCLLKSIHCCQIWPKGKAFWGSSQYWISSKIHKTTECELGGWVIFSAPLRYLS